MSSTTRRTKIISTLGPATESEEMLEKIILAGVDVVRLNMAHASHDWTRMIIRRIRGVSKKINREVAIMMDIKGPEIRTGDVSAPIDLQPGQIFDFTIRPSTQNGEGEEEIRSVSVNYKDIINDINVSDIVLVDSGLLRFEVLEKNENRIRCKALIKGQLTSRRHINLPGVKVNLPSFTDKDRKDSLVGIEEGIDFIAMSFVREANDIEQLREFLRWHDSRIQIIAKIEDQEAITNLESIVQACDALMVARGDLGIEIPYETLPLVQRRAVSMSIAARKPVIVATHMLESMIQAPVPTRAEVTDVANAALELADSVMLSGETTTGRHPVKCVEVMARIAATVERSLPRRLAAEQADESPKIKLLRAAAGMAQDIPGAGIVAFTRNGDVPRNLSAMRAVGVPVYAFMEDPLVHRKMSLLWGVESFLTEFTPRANDNVVAALRRLRDAGRCRPGQMMVIVTNVILGPEVIDSVQLRAVPAD